MLRVPGGRDRGRGGRVTGGVEEGCQRTGREGDRGRVTGGGEGERQTS